MSSFASPRGNPLARRTLRVVVATVGGAPIGFARTLGCLWDEPDGCLLDEVTVVPERQRQGIGTSLVREAAIWMADIGNCRMWCQPIGAEWDRRDFYTPLGFRPVPESASSLVADIAVLCKVNRRSEQ